MKTNEAPEKIYVVDATFPNYVDFDGSPINTKRIDDHDIEYTRTNYFIEKAEKYLNQRLFKYISYYQRGVGVSTEEFIEEFIKTMRQ